MEHDSHRLQSRTRVLTLVALFLLAAATGCGGGRATLTEEAAKGAPIVEEPDPGSASAEELLQEAESQEERKLLREIRDFTEGPSGDYRIGINDKLSIVFYGDSELDRVVRVRTDGKISFPRVGDIPAAGLTPVELSGTISELYAEYLRNPEATVIVEESGDQVVYVLGEVNEQKPVTIQGQITLTQAIASAGGWTQTGKLESVMVVRRGGWDRPRAVRIDLEKVLSGERFAYDIPLRPYDIVYVPQSFIGDTGDFMENLFHRVVLPPLDAIVRGYEAMNPRTVVQVR